MARDMEDTLDEDLEAAGEDELDAEDDEFSAAAEDDDAAFDDDEDADGAVDDTATAEVVASDTARDLLRKQLADDVQRFLDAGGVIEEVPRNYRADMPSNAESSYGRGSL